MRGLVAVEPGVGLPVLRRSALAVACAIGLLVTRLPARAELWGTNDFIIAAGTYIAVLNPDLTFKAVQIPCGPFGCATLGGSLDWFANDDLLVSSRSLTGNAIFTRLDRNGNQLALCSTFGGTAGIYRPRDAKVSFIQTDVLVADGNGSGLAVRRFRSCGGQESTTSLCYGGLAVVTRTNGTHELWAAGDADLGGIRIYPMNAAGQVQFSQGVFANMNVPAAAVTMTFDAASGQVLFSNEGSGEIQAMSVETRQVVQTYSIPAAQRPVGAIFTGITTGPGGQVVAVESSDHWTYDPNRRVGLSVWNASGTNYQFFNLDGFPGFDLLNPSAAIVPENIVWAGNWIPPKLSQVTLTNGNFCGTATGLTGVNYLVQAATNLAAPVWQSIATNAAPFQFNDPATLPGRFYRVVPQ